METEHLWNSIEESLKIAKHVELQRFAILTLYITLLILSVYTFNTFITIITCVFSIFTLFSVLKLNAEHSNCIMHVAYCLEKLGVIRKLTEDEIRELSTRLNIPREYVENFGLQKQYFPMPLPISVRVHEAFTLLLYVIIPMPWLILPYAITHSMFILYIATPVVYIPGIYMIRRLVKKVKKECKILLEIRRPKEVEIIYR